jgi:hypothetical protein
MPAGPKGRFGPFLPFFWGMRSFGKNKSAAKSLLRHLSTRQAAQQMVAASKGYDIPSFANLTTFDTWAEMGPPKGTLYHYPNPYNHQILSIAAAPTPHRIAVQIYTEGLMTKMIVRHLQGEAMEQTLAWAEGELEGFMRSWRRGRVACRRPLRPPPAGANRCGRVGPLGPAIIPRSGESPHRSTRGVGCKRGG